MSPARKPRVAYVMKMYPRLAETFILNEILAHEAAGLRVDIFSMRSPVDGRFHAMLGQVQAHATYLPGASVKAEPFWDAVSRARRTHVGGSTLFDDDPFDEAANVYQGIMLADTVRERGITHIHAHFATAAAGVARIASRLTDVPYSFTAHAKDIYDDSVQEYDLRRKLRDAATVVTVSDYNLAWLREHFGDDAQGVRRIYNGLNLADFPYRPPVDRSPLIIGIGRLVEKKGFSDLIAACRILTDRGRAFECQIVGGGLLRGELAKQIKASHLDERVTLLGPRSREEVIQRVGKAAVMAAPCVISESGNRDGLPTVLLESMALGTPCISTDVTGIPELVRHEQTGLLARQNDPASLADALERLLDDQRLAGELAANARRLIEDEFDIERNTPVMREIFTASAAVRPPVTVEIL